MTERNGFRIELPKDPEILRLLEEREEAEEGGEAACLLGRLCPRCDTPLEATDAGERVCPKCGPDRPGGED